MADKANPVNNGLWFAPGYLIGYSQNCTSKNKVVNGLFRQGEDIFSSSRWVDAALVYEGCIKLDSTFCDAYLRLGQCYAEKGNLASALSIFQLAADKFPTNSIVSLALGQIYLSLGEPEVALPYFEKLFLLEGGNPEYYVATSLALYDCNRKTEALQYLQRGKQLVMTFLQGKTQLPPSYGHPSYIIFGKEFAYLKIYEGILCYELGQTDQCIKLLNSVYIDKGDHDMETLRLHFIDLAQKR